MRTPSAAPRSADDADHERHDARRPAEPRRSSQMRLARCERQPASAPDRRPARRAVSARRRGRLAERRRRRTISRPAERRPRPARLAPARARSARAEAQPGRLAQPALEAADRPQLAEQADLADRDRPGPTGRSRSDEARARASGRSRRRLVARSGRRPGWRRRRGCPGRCRPAGRGRRRRSARRFGSMPLAVRRGVP